VHAMIKKKNLKNSFNVPIKPLFSCSKTFRHSRKGLNWSFKGPESVCSLYYAGYSKNGLS
jgi:hypothetical protein